jgi:hypothetical protein
MEKLGCKHPKSSTTKWLLESSDAQPATMVTQPPKRLFRPWAKNPAPLHCLGNPTRKVRFLQWIGQRESLQGTRVFIPNSWIQEKANQTTNL